MQEGSQRRQRRPVHGVLLLHKPKGISSNQALQKAKFLLNAEKAGHTGTLDPFATGVLPLCFGAATKFSQVQLDAHKHYRAQVQLGGMTNTGDSEGEVLERAPVPADIAERLEAVRQQFLGVSEQIPPMYSALKKDGKPLYEYARAGQTVERLARQIEIFDLRFQLLDATRLLLDVHCSKGTYIRSLAEDIGKALGTYAYVQELERVQSGDFGLDACVGLEDLQTQSDEQRLQQLLPSACLLSDFPVVSLEASEAGRFLSGLRRRGDWPNAEQVAVYGKDPDTLLGTAQCAGQELIPRRLLNPREIEQTLAQNLAQSA